MGEFDDENELWWQPFQKLWHVDDEQWMAERRALWKRLSINTSTEDSLRGLRSLFLTGQTFDTHYKPKSNFDFETEKRIERIRVLDYSRLHLLPTFEPEILEKFANCVIEKRNGFQHISDTSYFWTISNFYNNTDMAHDLIMSIYKNLMGGGGIKDNPRYLQSVGRKFLGELEYQLQKYFSDIRFAQKKPDRDTRFLSELYEYFESVALFLCEHEDLMQERYFPQKIPVLHDSEHGRKEYEDKLCTAEKRRKEWLHKQKKLASLIPEKGSHLEELVNKAQALMKSNKFPEPLRRFLV